MRINNNSLKVSSIKHYWKIFRGIHQSNVNDKDLLSLLKGSSSNNSIMFITAIIFERGFNIEDNSIKVLKEFFI